MPAKFVLRKARDKFSFELLASNGQTIVKSGGYGDRRAATNAIAALRRNAGADVEDLTAPAAKKTVSATKSTAKKATARKSAGTRKSVARKSTPRKAAATSTARKATARKATARKATARKATARTSPRAAARRATPRASALSGS